MPYGFIYAAQINDNMFKVGSSKDPLARMNSLKYAFGINMELRYIAKIDSLVERDFHKKLSSYNIPYKKVSGIFSREVFRILPEEMEFEFFSFFNNALSVTTNPKINRGANNG